MAATNIEEITINNILCFLKQETVSDTFNSISLFFISEVLFPRNKDSSVSNLISTLLCSFELLYINCSKLSSRLASERPYLKDKYFKFLLTLWQ